MKPFTSYTGLVAPLDRANVDTDQIIPKQFLKKVERAGFGKHLFHGWRYLDDAETQPNPEFALNQPQYAGATILLARDNFGCGSSREHAPWALSDYGFRMIVAPSFADIFYTNAVKNGIVPARLSAQEIDALFAGACHGAGMTLTVDLAAQTITDSQGTQYHFAIDPWAREALLSGLDAIAVTETHADAIAAYEKTAASQRPWMWQKNN